MECRAVHINYIFKQHLNELLEMFLTLSTELIRVISVAFQTKEKLLAPEWLLKGCVTLWYKKECQVLLSTWVSSFCFWRAGKAKWV